MIKMLFGEHFFAKASKILLAAFILNSLLLFGLHIENTWDFFTSTVNFSMTILPAGSGQPTDEQISSQPLPAPIHGGPVSGSDVVVPLTVSVGGVAIADTQLAKIQWIFRRSSSVNYDSPFFLAETTGSNKLFIVPDGVLAVGEVYYWRARYKNLQDTWSAYSTETSFKVIAPPAAVVFVGGSSGGGGGGGSSGSSSGLNSGGMTPLFVPPPSSFSPSSSSYVPTMQIPALAPSISIPWVSAPKISQPVAPKTPINIPLPSISPPEPPSLMTQARAAVKQNNPNYNRLSVEKQQQLFNQEILKLSKSPLRLSSQSVAPQDSTVQKSPIQEMPVTVRIGIHKISEKQPLKIEISPAQKMRQPAVPLRKPTKKQPVAPQLQPEPQPAAVKPHTLPVVPVQPIAKQLPMQTFVDRIKNLIKPKPVKEAMNLNIQIRDKSGRAVLKTREAINIDKYKINKNIGNTSVLPAGEYVASFSYEQDGTIFATSDDFEVLPRTPFQKFAAIAPFWGEGILLFLLISSSVILRFKRGRLPVRA